MKFPNLLDHSEFAFDTETTGLNPMAGARVFGFSISTKDEDYYWDIRKNPEAILWFNREILLYKGTIICHNLSFDYRMSNATGIYFPLDKSVDTCILACLINEHEVSYALDNLSKKYTSSPKEGEDLYVKLAGMFGGRATRNVQIARIVDAPEDIVAPYAKSDTRATYNLYQYQKEEIKTQCLQRIVRFEQSITPILIKAESHGVAVNTMIAEIAVDKLSLEIRQLQVQLNKEAGFKCNGQPSGDIKKLFAPQWKNNRWWAIDGTPIPPTKKGGPSLGAETLRIMTHPAAKIILDLRSMIKTRDTFLVGHILESSYNGRVYPNINQAKNDRGGTSTGRLSYTSPALQQIPERNKAVAEIVKKVFIPDPGHSWVDSDLASFEVRIFAHLVGSESIKAIYENDPETDFHQYVSDLTGLARNATYSGQPNAKQLNLAMIFNQGNGATAEKMGMPWEWDSFVPADSVSGEEIIYQKAGPEAKDIIEKYHKHLPGVRKLASGCKSIAESRGYLFTRHGRHLRFPKGYKSYKSSGILIQATSADENKVNWMRINRAIEGTGAEILLNIHDSYSFSIPKGSEKEVMQKVKSSIEEDRGLNVPMILEVSQQGKNWWDSKKSTRWM